MEKFDCVIIGGGIVGTTILWELSKFKNYSVALLEMTEDVAGGATKANSGIVHAGYDCKPNTLKAKFNVEGNKIFHEICGKLDVPFLNCGSMVVARSGEIEKLKALKERGEKNGVETEIIGKEKILQIEPNVSQDVEIALFAKTAGIVSPYKFCIATADNAIENGGKIFTQSKVLSIKKLSAEEFNELLNKENCKKCKISKLNEGTKKEEKLSGGFLIKTSTQEFLAKSVINSAGAGASGINELCGAETYEVEYRRGEYLLLDSAERKNIKTILFPLPSDKGKGVLIAPTVGGNVIYGPTSDVVADGSKTETSENGIIEIANMARQNYAKVNLGNVIRVYAGVRSIVGEDFVIEFSQKVEGLFMLLGICSPGITASPAIARFVAREFQKKFALTAKTDSELIAPKKYLRFAKLDEGKLSQLIKENKAWGNIVCRCETISEAEIVEAIHSPLPALSLDAIKRRTKAGMGRCQGGFCTQKVMEIIARETGRAISEINKTVDGTNIAVAKIKESE